MQADRISFSKWIKKLPVCLHVGGLDIQDKDKNWKR